ncbi:MULTISPECIES: class I SAM-dependent methyltransferase [unclassified Pseudodesulfovibrio]|uniref:class I SAM-dependent methyltransferase n=1 Tax=unclassified Pseudodesulfovibrio TaxID=2661612 RepID=UPI000FEBC834|nr:MULTISPECIES: class I SAM-dependent methyltransferase [unclassified Pseudodesulfovibrio]MCJ2163529.1 methyltransferase domain-containing protein [Pseudodesulfovibrio sp. S3-i]RWU06765.1 SAM-dependent methyltransferase [Pseudodesulfovibrio sp. S3]
MTDNARIRKAFTGDHVLQYDQKAEQAGWLDPDILFGLSYRYVNPGETVLDVGIGTGLASILFHRVGLRVIGLDFSSEMLAVCRQKNFASGLLEHDVSVAPYPLDDGAVHHAVCSGLLHVFSDLSVIFVEVSRVLKQGGIFAFVVPDQGEGGEKERRITGRNEHSPVFMQLHSLSSIIDLSGRCGFDLINSLHFSAASIGRQEMPFRAYLARKE